MNRYRTWVILALAVLVAGCSQVAVPVNDVYRSEGDKQIIRGLATAAKTLNVSAFQRRLPPSLAGQEEIMVVIDDCSSCRAAVGLPYTENKTGMPAVLISDLELPQKPFAQSVSRFTRKEMDCISTEVFNVAPVGLLINLRTKQITVAKGPFDTWSSCFGRLQQNKGMVAQG